jgi:hypothetical protein
LPIYSSSRFLKTLLDVYFSLPLSTDQCFNSTNMSIANLTPTQLRQAADLKEKIAGLQNQLQQLEGSKADSIVASPSKSVKPAKRKISAAHIAKIRAAQKLRWAKVHAAKAKPAAAKAVVKSVAAIKPAKKKFTMSAAAKAKISAAAKARWAKVNAAKVQPAAPKLAVKPVVAPKDAAKPAPASKPARKKISAEGIARIKAAQKARWAKIKGEAAKKK